MKGREESAGTALATARYDIEPFPRKEVVMNHLRLIVITIALTMGVTTTSWAAGGGGGGGSGGSGGAAVRARVLVLAQAQVPGQVQVNNNGINANSDGAATNSNSNGINSTSPGYNGTINHRAQTALMPMRLVPQLDLIRGAQRVPEGRPDHVSRVGNDDTIGGRTGPPGSPMINSGETGTPNIAANPPCIAANPPCGPK